MVNSLRNVINLSHVSVVNDITFLSDSFDKLFELNLLVFDHLHDSDLMIIVFLHVEIKLS